VTIGYNPTPRPGGLPAGRKHGDLTACAAPDRRQVYQTDAKDDRRVFAAGWGATKELDSKLDGDSRCGTLHRHGSAIARKVLGWPKRCELAHAFLWGYNDRILKLAQLLGQLGDFLTYEDWCARASSDAAVAAAPSTAWRRPRRCSTTGPPSRAWRRRASTRDLTRKAVRSLLP
jgi:hypothetical protein